MFSECENLREVIISEGTKEIMKEAFSYCYSLEKVVVPESVTKISDNVFKGSEKVTMYGTTGSYAQEYAEENDIPFVDIQQM